MELLAMIGTNVLVSEGEKQWLIPFTDIGCDHPLINDEQSFRLGYMACMNRAHEMDMEASAMNEDENSGKIEHSEEPKELEPDGDYVLNLFIEGEDPELISDVEINADDDEQLSKAK